MSESDHVQSVIVTPASFRLRPIGLALRVREGEGFNGDKFGGSQLLVA